MPAPVTSTSNLHTVHCYGHGLGVECQCGHRAILAAERIGARAGNMRLLSSLRLVCTACGSRQWTGWLIHSADDAAAFLAPPTGQPSS